MCVKEFYGYNCGHCSVPVLRQCPLSASNPHYPVCKFPAERPIFTDDFCHPCSRVVWNMKVLKEEKEHRARHMQGECACEVIFEGEDREKRLRTRGNKGKGKGKGNEASQGGGQQYEGTGVVDHGAFERGMAEAEPGGYGGEGGLDIEEYGGGLENNMQMVRLDDSSARGSWEPAAQMAAYEYVGYYVDSQNQPQGTDPEQSYTVALGGDYGQIPMGDVGSGMRWYPQHQQQYYQAPQLPAAPIFNDPIESAPRGPRAAYFRASSLPYGRYDNPGAAEYVQNTVVHNTQPLVVSSDMTRSEST